MKGNIVGVFSPVLNLPFMQNGYALLHNSVPSPTSIKNLINASMPRRD